jgi:hypothetical protein
MVAANGAADSTAPCRLTLQFAEVNVHDFIELGFCRLGKARMQRIARVIHKVIEPLSSPSIQGSADFGDESVE